MNRTTNPWTRIGGTAALTVLVSAILGTAAFAQFGGPPPGGPSFDGPRFGGPPPRDGMGRGMIGRGMMGRGMIGRGMMGRGMIGRGMMGRGMRGPRPSTAANVPLSALTAGLKLTTAQQTKIANIQARMAQQSPDLMPRPGEDPPPDSEVLRAAMDGRQAASQSADTGIEAVLTVSQKAALPVLLKTLDDLRRAGIPPATYGTLKLTNDQKTRIMALAQTLPPDRRPPTDRPPMGGDPRGGGFGSFRPAMRSGRDPLMIQAAAVLTPSQRDLVDKYKASHPRPPFGGPGRPGGPDGFGPPPPRDGFGPPPPDEPRAQANARGSQDEDHGRPVALVARELGVTPAQFRAAFRKVHPAGAGQEPTESQRQANRKVLSESLGVSPERLDAVMDKYRPGGRGTNGPPRPPQDAPPPPDGNEQ